MKKIISLIVALVLVLSLACAVAEKPFVPKPTDLSRFLIK